MALIAIYDGTRWIPIGGDGGGIDPSPEEVYVGSVQPSPVTDIWIDTDEPDPVAATAARYVHKQLTPASTWVVQHNLGLHPQVYIEDAAGYGFYGGIRYIDANLLWITLRGDHTGSAYCM